MLQAALSSAHWLWTLPGGRTYPLRQRTLQHHSSRRRVVVREDDVVVRREGVVDVIIEVRAALQNASFFPELFDFLEIRSRWFQMAIDHAIGRFAQDVSEQTRVLVVIELTNELRCRHAIVHS